MSMSKTRILTTGRGDLCGELESRYKKEKNVKKRTRLLAMKLVSSAKHTAKEVGELSGCSRSNVFSWLKLFREGGYEALLNIGKSGPSGMTMREVGEETKKELIAGIEEGRWTSTAAIVRWLKAEKNIEKQHMTVWFWVKKLGGVLRVPRPSHPKKDPVAVEAFKSELSERLHALAIPQGSKVKVWVFDEARFGLHTILRKVIIKKGTAPVRPRQTRYDWDYLYGALDVVEGDSHFLHLPTVNQECSSLFLETLIETYPDHHHVLIGDQAGFHFRPKDERLPLNVHILQLPPYSPELNPCEQAWSFIKTGISNTIHKSIVHLRNDMLPHLKYFLDSPHNVLSLVGRPWLHLQANAL